MYIYDIEMLNDTYSEIYLTNRCRELLKIYTKEELLQLGSNPKTFSCLFTSLCLNDDQINFALLKKYYLTRTSHQDDKIIPLMENGYFNIVDSEISTNHSKRLELLDSFLGRINDNYQENNKEDVIVIQELQQYYQNKDYSQIYLRKKGL